MVNAKIIGISAILILTFSFYLPVVNSQNWEPTEAKVVYRSSWVANDFVDGLYSYGLYGWSPWSPDGKSLALLQTAEKRLVVLNTENGSVSFSKNYSENSDFELMTELEYSPDGRYLAVSSMHLIEILETKNWSVAYNLHEFHSSFSWSPDGKYLAYINMSTGYSVPDYIKILNTRDWKIHHEMAIGTVGEEVISWSPDGKYIAYGDSLADCIHIIDASTWTNATNLNFSLDTRVWRIEWSPDSRYLVAGELVMEPGQINRGKLEVWNTSTWKRENSVNFGIGTIPCSLSWNLHRPILAVGLYSEVLTENITPKLYLVNTENWTVYRELKPFNETELSSIQKDIHWAHFYSVAWSPDGNSLAAGYKDVVVYTTEKGLFGGGTTENQNLLSQPLLWAAIGIIVLAVAVSVWYWKKKGGKKENMETEEVNPDRENERP